MNLFSKIFFSVISVISLIFLFAGYFLLSYSFNSNIERETDFALSQYKNDKFTLQAGLIINEEKLASEGETAGIFRVIADDIASDICILSENGDVIFNEMKENPPFSPDELKNDSYCYRIVNSENETCILFESKVKQRELEFYFITKTDITETISRQRNLQGLYEKCYIAVFIIGCIMILFLSAFLTRPLKKMTAAAECIANGHYNMRLDIRGRDELGELSASFNRMAFAVEQAVGELSEEARKKEDFVANFAHELKTPLTSMIGYADRIYQNEMPRNEVKQAAWYIWNEGMRLESLSQKLMDLTNFNRQEFSLEYLPADELLLDITREMSGILKDKNVSLICRTEPAYMKTDYDLMKTLILNIIDNAVKAECTSITINGIRWEDEYQIEITDDGKGIPENELHRITEAFYMVDKVRSRKQHGAGIGLSLVKRIMEIQNGELYIESQEGKGTAVTLCLPLENAETEYNMT